MKIATRNPTAGQRGFSLVEIMVALTISLILMAGVIQIFLSSRASYRLQNGMARLQENGRFAMDFLSRDIGNAGFTTGTAAIAPINSANSTDGGGNVSDAIEISYQGTTDCLGQAAASPVINRYYVNDTNLMCLGNGNATPQPLIGGVQNMQILYGQDTDGDNIANLYVSAGNVTNWASVVSVRIALLLSTVNAVNDQQDTNTYTLLNAPPIGPPNDNLQRRVYTKTIILRNQL